MSITSVTTALNTFTEIAPVVVVSTSNLAGIYSNGPTNTGVGAQLVATSAGVLTIDGISLNVGDRLLLAGQSASSQNGIYVVLSNGSSASWTIQRAGDMQSIEQLLPGKFVIVASGSLNAGRVFTIAAPLPAFVGGGSINFKPASVAGFQNIIAYNNPMPVNLFVVPATTTLVLAKIWGGGGAGGGGAAGTNCTGGGGGGGEYVEKTLSVNGGDTISSQVGGGGFGQDQAPGGNGSPTTVTYGGITYTAHGGTGGALGTSTPGAGAAGGPGGNGGNGDINIRGGSGLNGVTGIADTTGCGGASPNGGAGGIPAFGAGAGNSGIAPGGGGSGASSNTGVDLGGNGANGLIVFYYN